MNSFLQKAAAFRLSPGSFPLALLGVCLLAYGLLVPYLGFYWDDFPLIWIAEELGSEGLERYFSTNRPYWGQVYQVTIPLLGSEPARWQLFAIFWRWASATTLWGVLRLAWPRAPQAAVWSALLFAVYPGFGQQFISLVYSHFFIVLTAFLLSLWLTLLALQRPRLFWPLTIFALLLSMFNLLTMEYFFMLELIRPVLIWLAMGEKLRGRSLLSSYYRARLKRSLLVWLPYLAVFLSAVVWRAFFFRFQTQNYRPLLLEQMKTQPLLALGQLLLNVLSSLWRVIFEAWGSALSLPSPAVLGTRTTLVYFVLAAFTTLLVGVYLFKVKQDPMPGTEGAGWAKPAVLTGLAACFLAGWPVWLIDLAPYLSFPADRFTLPFMFGACLTVAGLIGLIPARTSFTRPALLARFPGVGPAILAVLVGAAVGQQFQLANTYRRDWESQKRFFWQLAWRMPGLEAGAILLSNDLPITFYSDNSLTAPLNWIYSRPADREHMDYVLYFPSARLGTKLPDLVKDIPVEQDYLAATFTGTTSQAVAIFYEPPACLRVLDPQLDVSNYMAPALMRKSAAISSTRPILPEGAPYLPENIFGPEPAHAWCYYYQKADLARQQGRWEEAAALGEIAFSLGDYPNDPSERIPFVEAYAHTGDWQAAMEQSREAQRITPLMEPVLCRLWSRIAQSAPESIEKEAAVQSMREALACAH